MKKQKLLRRLGLALVGLGLVGFVLWAGPMVLMEARFRLGWFEAQAETLPVIESLEQTGFGVILEDLSREAGFAGILRRVDISFYDPKDPGFTVLIPKIGVNAYVVADVPVEDEAAYREALKIGVAHARGTYLPGESKTTLIFGHSTNYAWTVSRYNALFYLLKELEPGDETYLFYNEVKYDYRVSRTEIVKVDELAKINDNLEEDQLVLMTCWPPGTTWKRLLVWTEPA
ncbi:sortase [Patescibacteria group bacterium]|nr:sortase [Patescibacteria group bacterium]